MKSLLMLPLIVALSVVTCARAFASPEDPPVVFCDDTDIFSPDAISGADPAYQMIDYRPSKELRELKAAIDEVEATAAAERAATDRVIATQQEALDAYKSISYQPGRDGLMDPFADAAPSSAAAPTVSSPTVPDPADDPGAFASMVIAAARAGKWLIVIGLAMMLLVAGGRYALAKKWAWFGTDKGGVVATLGITFLTVAGSSMAAGIWDPAVIVPAFVTFVAAAVMVYVVPKKSTSKS